MKFFERLVEQYPHFTFLCNPSSHRVLVGWTKFRRGSVRLCSNRTSRDGMNRGLATCASLGVSNIFLRMGRHICCGRAVSEEVLLGDEYVHLDGVRVQSALAGEHRFVHDISHMRSRVAPPKFTYILTSVLHKKISENHVERNTSVSISDPWIYIGSQYNLPGLLHCIICIPKAPGYLMAVDTAFLGPHSDISDVLKNEFPQWRYIAHQHVIVRSMNQDVTHKILTRSVMPCQWSSECHGIILRAVDFGFLG